MPRIVLTIQEWITASVMSIAFGLSAVMLSTGRSALSPMTLWLMLMISGAVITSVYMNGTRLPLWQLRSRVLLRVTLMLGIGVTVGTLLGRTFHPTFIFNVEEVVLLVAQFTMFATLIPSPTTATPPPPAD